MDTPEIEDFEEGNWQAQQQQDEEEKRQQSLDDLAYLYKEIGYRLDIYKKARDILCRLASELGIEEEFKQRIGNRYGI